jgi:peptidoglycan/LPS O-acetylase OafA/YrhL
VVNRAVWALADLRHDCVVLFFVLSGYLVGGSLLRRAPQFDVRAYAIARFSRIYIVLLPALVLTAALDGLARHWAPGSPVYAAVWPEGVFGDAPPFSHYGWREITASLLSIENFLGAPIGSDGPLWSLGFEWVFYFAMPALLLASERLGRFLRLPPWPARAGLLAASVVALVAAHMLYVALLWLIWTAGAAAQLLARRGGWPAALRWGGAIVCVLGLGLSLRINYRLSDALIGFGFAAFLCLYPVGERGLWPPLDRTLAGASYSLYVTHLPVVAFVCMLFVRAGLLQAGGVAPGWGLAGMLAAGAAGVSVACLVSYSLFERRTEVLRGLLLRWTAARRS